MDAPRRYAQGQESLTGFFPDGRATEIFSTAKVTIDISRPNVEAPSQVTEALQSWREHPCSRSIEAIPGFGKTKLELNLLKWLLNVCPISSNLTG
jgi:hypothetical protein